MTIRWDLHRQVLGEIWYATKFLVVRIAAVVAYLAAFGATAVFFGLIGAIVALSITVIAIWYWAEYREAKRIDDLRNRTGGMCG